MRLIDGKKMAEEIRDSIRKKNNISGICPNLAIFLVGDNKESMVYVGLKENALRSIGGISTIIQLPSQITKEDLLTEIHKANADDSIHGIIIQLPLPEHLNPYQDEFLEAIKEEKDVDGFNPSNRGKLIGGQPRYISCAALACIEVIKRHVEILQGKTAVLVGDSFDLIMPLSILLIGYGCHVKVIHEYNPKWIKEADILVVEKGSARIVKGEHLGEDMLVIDAGFYWDNGKTHGNVDKDTIEAINGDLLPVPGGMGPLLIAKLMENVSEASIINRSN